MIELSAEEKIKLLSIALRSTDLYNDRVYKLHEYCYKLINEIISGRVSCVNITESVSELEELIEGFKMMIYKYENYREIMNQISNVN
ncbi:hypothetical protein [Rubrolithibacter danxiaensis]|uniref:hypothetical protein n=1 Tax=Rubrolithibacter danxiaensis TaxID=3390805 RepID=UPI003BF8C471